MVHRVGQGGPVRGRGDDDERVERQRELQGLLSRIGWGHLGQTAAEWGRSSSDLNLGPCPEQIARFKNPHSKSPCPESGYGRLTCSEFTRERLPATPPPDLRGKLSRAWVNSPLRHSLGGPGSCVRVRVVRKTLRYRLPQGARTRASYPYPVSPLLRHSLDGGDTCRPWC